MALSNQLKKKKAISVAQIRKKVNAQRSPTSSATTSADSSIPGSPTSSSSAAMSPIVPIEATAVESPSTSPTEFNAPTTRKSSLVQLVRNKPEPVPAPKIAAPSNPVSPIRSWSQAVSGSREDAEKKTSSLHVTPIKTKTAAPATNVNDADFPALSPTSDASSSSPESPTRRQMRPTPKQKAKIAKLGERRKRRESISDSVVADEKPEENKCATPAASREVFLAPPAPQSPSSEDSSPESITPAPPQARLEREPQAGISEFDERPTKSFAEVVSSSAGDEDETFEDTTVVEEETVEEKMQQEVEEEVASPPASQEILVNPPPAPSLPEPSLPVPSPKPKPTRQTQQAPEKQAAIEKIPEGRRGDRDPPVAKEKTETKIERIPEGRRGDRNPPVAKEKTVTKIEKIPEGRRGDRDPPVAEEKTDTKMDEEKEEEASPPAYREIFGTPPPARSPKPTPTQKTQQAAPRQQVAIEKISQGKNVAKVSSSKSSDDKKSSGDQDPPVAKTKTEVDGEKKEEASPPASREIFVTPAPSLPAPSPKPILTRKTQQAPPEPQAESERIPEGRKNQNVANVSKSSDDEKSSGDRRDPSPVVKEKTATETRLEEEKQEEEGIFVNTPPPAPSIAAPSPSPKPKLTPPTRQTKQAASSHDEKSSGDIRDPPPVVVEKKTETETETEVEDEETEESPPASREVFVTPGKGYVPPTKKELLVLLLAHIVVGGVIGGGLAMVVARAGRQGVKRGVAAVVGLVGGAAAGALRYMFGRG